MIVRGIAPTRTGRNVRGQTNTVCRNKQSHVLITALVSITEIILISIFTWNSRCTDSLAELLQRLDIQLDV